MKSKLSNKVFILVCSLLFLFLYPVKVVCKVTGYSCTTPPDENGMVSTVYDIEPLGIKFIESLTGSDCFFKYKRGYDKRSTSSDYSGVVPVGTNILREDIQSIDSYERMISSFGEPDKNEEQDELCYIYYQEDGTSVVFCFSDKSKIKYVVHEDFYGNREYWFGDEYRTISDVLSGQFLVGTSYEISKYSDEELLEDDGFIGKLLFKEGSYEFVHSGNDSSQFDTCDFVGYKEGTYKICYNENISGTTILKHLSSNQSLGAVELVGDDSYVDSASSVIDQDIYLNINYDRQNNRIELLFNTARARPCSIFRSVEVRSYP